MNGPEHYLEAERLLELNDTDAGSALRQDGADLLAEAQVHATLALAAATAEPIAQSYDGTYDKTIPALWSEVIS